jgi:hypothetical protein
VAQFPERTKAFDYAMQSQTQAAMPTMGLFPFAGEISKFKTDDETSLVADIGWGKGHITQRIKELCPDLKSRIVPQDRSDVIDNISGELLGIERMKYDFITPQPIKGMPWYWDTGTCHG